MDVSYLIQVLQKKEIILSNAKAQAFSVGDLEGLNVVDQELLETQSTLSQLQLLADVTHAAASNNTSAASMLAGSIDALQNTIQGPSASAIINGYDVSSYATDPLYEQKIQAILAAMPAFEHIEDVDTYIQTVAPGSPVTAEMIKDSIAAYNVDTQLLIAIMQNDSQFGTQGIGARTNNPGNVGNTGYASQSYASWNDGVLAVAEWLSRHRVVVQTVPEPPPAPVPVATEVIRPLPVPVVPIVPSFVTTTPTMSTTTDSGTSTPPIIPESTGTTTPMVPALDLSSTTPNVVEDVSSSTATTTP